MIYLRVTDLLLSPPVTHTSTDWQVADDLQFTSITAQSLGDTTNLTSMLFDTPLDPEVKYYARSRVLLSTGYTAWSNIDIFTPKDVPTNTINAPLPSLVSLPAVTITNNGMNVPIFGTTVTIAPVATLGGADHVSTTYVLETLSGGVAWCTLRNITYKDQITIPPGAMTPNTAYRLRIIIHTNSNDSSQVITTTIKSVDRVAGLIMNNLEGAASNADLSVDVLSAVGLAGIVGTLYSLLNDQTTLVGTYIGGGVGSNVLTIPVGDLRPSHRYLIRVVTGDPDIWDQRIFTTS